MARYGWIKLATDISGVDEIGHIWFRCKEIQPEQHQCSFCGRDIAEADTGAWYDMTEDSFSCTRHLEFD